ncbi:MAG: Fe(2+)-trafficking protein [Acidobacteriota bacterium]|nr:Fe(2+)-trafficking protein [Acidobacteriota bacterium]
MADNPAPQLAGHCRRCGRDNAPKLARPPLPGPAGADIQAHYCADCWAEWTRLEVMTINELRLNFMDPEAQDTLNRHMREFLDPASKATGPKPV